jgi:lipopolysaccharide export LptBFGC system permease protein LptF
LGISLLFTLGVSLFLIAVLICGASVGIDDSLAPTKTRTVVAAYAQTTTDNNNNNNFEISSNSQEPVETSVDENNSDTATTFSAIGQISSLVITVPESGFNITNAFKVILTGEWNLNVNDGNMTEFAVNFLASPMDGSKPHLHQVTDFRPHNIAEPITLTEDNSLSVNGTANIKINGILVWESADISISVSKGNTFIFDPNDVDTDNHFGDQQVYGIVTRLIL